ncbi:MAG: T9SS type A sorting domain-containing protein [Flavobacteriales bacterium]|nr:T9SS type A sorting domain-containing protein [Flavobacteriales bacterium]MBT5090674.1 T9SS type A sorting domain-containing protein [Flavobacteriales bacterium]
MKKNLQSVFTIFLLSLGLSVNAQTRYLDDVFSAVTVTSNVTYATNISILPMLQGLAPGPANLKCDIYEPTGDTETNRPVIILVHTGSFLPPVVNGQPTGSKTDLSIVEQCTRWAKKGYVAVAMENRLGWNPTSTDQTVRTSSLLQAAYRGIQDAKAMVRYMRMTEDTGNPYGIDESKIVLGGQGTGGYISLAYDALDNPAVELNLLKFLDLTDPLNPVPYVYPPIFGNPDGTDSTYFPANTPPFMFPVAFLWNIPNNPSYSNEISMAFNIGGSLADSSWLEAGDVPMVSFHCAKDENGPYANGDVIVPTTGNFVVEAQGSYIVQKHQDMYGNNAAFSGIGFTDPITAQSVINNTTYSTINSYPVGNNYEGLYTFVTPTPSATPTPFGAYTEEGAPWDWWDNTWYEATAQAVNGPAPAGYFAATSMLGNPNMSATHGNLYLDTIHGYLNPRMYEVLNLAVDGCTDPLACNFNPLATVDDGSCILPDGCTDSLACNYDSTALCDDGSCNLPDGCTDPSACNFNASALCDDGSCLTIYGCTDTLACNYSATATCDDGSCLTIYGCMNPSAINYDSLATCPDSCIFPVVTYGCTDSIAMNYNPLATIDDSSCIYCVYGCMNIIACNYDSLATCDDGSCLTIYGCTDTLACNYSTTATCDDGNCILPDGCTDSTAFNYDPTALCDDGSCIASSWDCISPGDCQDPGTGLGQYSSLANCNASCLVNSINEKTSDLLIYPNPANNILTIVSNTVEIENINIYNLNGQLVLNKELNNNTINVSSLESGIYIVDILSENNSVKRKLIIE